MKGKMKAVVEIHAETFEIVNTFRSGVEAGKMCFISNTSISKCCHGIRKHAGNRIFMFEEDYQKIKYSKC